MKKNIAFIMSNLDVGGAERHVTQLVSHLNHQKYSVVVFCIISKGKLAADIESHGIIVDAPKKECNWHALNHFQKLWCVFINSIRLLRFFRNEQPDIAHFFLPMPYLIGGVLSMFCGVKHRVMSRRSLNVYQKSYPVVAKIESYLHKTMSLVLGNSEAVVNELKQEGGNPELIRLIYNGVELPDLMRNGGRSFIRDQLGIGKDEVVIIIVANIIPYKGHEDLIRGLYISKNKLPDNWKLLCVGNDSHGAQSSLVALSDELGIKDHVIFSGSRNDVQDIFLSSNLAVLCSHQEGFSNAVLEAMAAALPMVVTDVGGNAEAVRDGVDGYVVPPHSPVELGDAIAKILCDPSLQKSMGNAARERVESCFSMQTCVSNYEAMYDEILGK